MKDVIVMLIFSHNDYTRVYLTVLHLLHNVQLHQPMLSYWGIPTVSRHWKGGI